MMRPDPWLSEQLGHRCWRLEAEASPQDPAEVRAALLQAAAGKAGFAYAKVPTARVGKVACLADAGFRIVDVSVTLDRPVAAPPGAFGPGVDVGELRAGEEPAVLGIAGSSFRYSRFHLDPRIPRSAADAVKRAWVESYLKGARGEHLLVARRGRDLAGFLAVLAQPGPPTAWVIDLIAVAEAHQGQGVGRTLVQAFHHAAAGHAEVLRVGTQAANVPSLRLYEQAGFRVADTAYVLHAHVDGGRVL